MGYSMIGFVGIFYVLFSLAMIGLSIYIIVLVIMFLKRGIAALDIYLSEKRNGRF